jgi:hypothetical protein
VQELDTLVLDRPTEVLDDPLAGRHRAVPPPARRVLTRIAAGTVAVLAVAGLGWVTAGAVGLTSVDVPTAMDFPSVALRPDAGDPTPPRTVDVATRPAPATTPVEPPVPDAAAPGEPAPEVRAASRAVREPEASVEPAPVRTVKVGDPCSSPGAVGVTARGKRAVCTSGGGPTRWKHA